MNLRCSYCQTPFAIGRTEMLLALQTLQAEGLRHYDAHCPRCRRTNQIPRERLEHAFPGWEEALAAFEKSAEAQPEPEAKPAKNATAEKTADETKKATVKKK